MKATSRLILILASCCATAVPFTTLAQEAKQEVDLDASFQIPQRDISHTPTVVFTRDGKRMLTATSKCEIAVFDVSTRTLVKRVRFPQKGTDGVSIDSSGRYAVWALSTGGVAVMQIRTERIIARDPKLRVRWVSVSPDGKTLAVSHEKSLALHDLITLKRIRSLCLHQASITNIVWNRDGAFLGSTAQDGRLVVYDLKRDRRYYEVRKEGALYALDFHPTGRAVAFGGRDKKVYEYDFVTKKEVVISKNQPYWITCLGYSPDGTMVAVGDESCDIWLYTRKTRELAFHNKHHVECWLSAVAWAPDNETFLFGCRPNSHAGRPTLHRVLTQTEAARSAQARASRRKLLQAIEKTLASTKSGEEKKKIEAYRKALLAEERLHANSVYTVAYGDLTGATLMNSPQIVQTFSLGFFSNEKTSPGSVSFKSLPPKLRALAEAHQKIVVQEMKKLEGNFCLNQWKVKKK